VVDRIADKAITDLCSTMVDGVVLAKQSVLAISVHGVRVGSSLRSSVVGAVGTVSRVAGVLLGSVAVSTVDLVVPVAGGSDSASSVGGVVRGADIGGVASGEGASWSGSDDILLKIPVVGLLLALPEVALGRAAGVVVGGARAETLLLLVLANKEDLEESGDEEQESGNDGHGEDSGVHAASVARRDSVGEVLAVSSAETVVAEALRVGVGIADTERGVDDASARGSTVAGQNSDGNEAADEEDVKDNRGEGEEADTTKAASEDHGSDGVQNSHAGDTLNSLLPSGDALVAIGLDREEV